MNILEIKQAQLNKLEESYRELQEGLLEFARDAFFDKLFEGFPELKQNVDAFEKNEVHPFFGQDENESEPVCIHALQSAYEAKAETLLELNVLTPYEIISMQKRVNEELEKGLGNPFENGFMKQEETENDEELYTLQEFKSFITQHEGPMFQAVVSFDHQPLVEEDEAIKEILHQAFQESQILKGETNTKEADFAKFVQNIKNVKMAVRRVK